MYYIFMGYILPVVLGFVIGYIFILPVAIAVSLITAAYALYLYISTYNQGLGSIIGMIAAFTAFLFNLSLWITVFVVNGNYISLSGLLR